MSSRQKLDRFLQHFIHEGSGKIGCAFSGAFVGDENVHKEFLRGVFCVLAMNFLGFSSGCLAISSEFTRISTKAFLSLQMLHLHFY